MNSIIIYNSIIEICDILGYSFPNLELTNINLFPQNNETVFEHFSVDRLTTELVCFIFPSCLCKWCALVTLPIILSITIK